MDSRKVVFHNADGHELAARLELPEDPIAYALFAHCFTCSKNYKAVTNISRALCARGIAVLRFDFTGLGESEGEFGDTNFSTNVTDLVSAAGFLGDEYQAPKILIGHSLGGAAVLRAASQVPACVAVATIAAPFDPAHLAGLLAPVRAVIEERGEAEVVIGGTRFRIKKQFLDDLEESGMRQAIRELGRALLVFHSPADTVVGIESAQNIFLTARHPKSFVSLDRADHLLLDESDSRYVGEVISAWAGKYVAKP
ncbi:MAG: alpha/beta fold hydrolase [Candidatus Krumholzibacteria bacterium]